jgi:hypothetical protein
VPHGREQKGDFLRVMGDIGAFLHHLDHEDNVELAIDVAQAREIAAQLIAEHEPKGRGFTHAVGPSTEMPAASVDRMYVTASGQSIATIDMALL